MKEIERERDPVSFLLFYLLSLHLATRHIYCYMNIIYHKKSFVINYLDINFHRFVIP